MYCYKCGKNEKKMIKGVCSECGTTIETELSDEKKKLLTQAAHGRLHKAGDFFNLGMSGIVLGGIALIIALLFYSLSFKAAAGGVLVTTCTEFYVFCALGSLGVIGLIFGIVVVSIALYRKNLYKHLIKDIQNKTFVQ